MEVQPKTPRAPRQQSAPEADDENRKQYDDWHKSGLARLDAIAALAAVKAENEKMSERETALLELAIEMGGEWMQNRNSAPYHIRVPRPVPDDVRKRYEERRNDD